ncbi:MAG: RNase P subunit p30 family protein, partial [Halodesulfurarchaeum sp.]
YEAVRVAAEGPTTLSRFANTAARSGFDGVVVRNRYANPAEYDREKLTEAFGIDVVPGIEIDADDRTAASGTIGHRRAETVILVLRGGTPDLNRFAAETPKVDVLSNPMGGEGDLNHVIVRAAAENGVRLEVDLGPALRMSGGPRVQHLRALRKQRELIQAYDAPYVVSASPRTHLQIRRPRELVALGAQLDFEAEFIEAGLEEWEHLAERNRERRSDSYVGPGVRIEPGDDFDRNDETDTDTDGQ